MTATRERRRPGRSQLDLLPAVASGHCRINGHERRSRQDGDDPSRPVHSTAAISNRGCPESERRARQGPGGSPRPPWCCPASNCAAPRLAATRARVTPGARPPQSAPGKSGRVPRIRWRSPATHPRDRPRRGGIRTRDHGPAALTRREQQPRVLRCDARASCDTRSRHACHRPRKGRDWCSRCHARRGLPPAAVATLGLAIVGSFSASASLIDSLCRLWVATP